MSRAVLVTGAAGFIGSHLVDALLARGFDVVGLDDLSLGRRSNLRQALACRRFRLVRADLGDERACLRALRLRRFEALWHLAANSDIQAGARDPEVDLARTFLTTYHALALAGRLKIRRFAFASTSAIYGEHDRPVAEDSGPLLPVSNYGAMKLASEGAVSAATQTILERAWIFRFPNVVGGRATHGAILDFVRKLRKDPRRLEVLGDGRQKKPYLHVAELVEAMLYCFTRGRHRLNLFNIGAASGTATTVREIAELVVARVSPGARVHYAGGARGWVGDVPRFQYSTRKLAAFGWKPKLTSTQAVARAVCEIAAENP